MNSISSMSKLLDPLVSIPAGLMMVNIFSGPSAFVPAIENGAADTLTAINDNAKIMKFILNVILFTIETNWRSTTMITKPLIVNLKPRVFIQRLFYVLEYCMSGFHTVVFTLLSSRNNWFVQLDWYNTFAIESVWRVMLISDWSKYCLEHK